MSLTFRKRAYSDRREIFESAIQLFIWLIYRYSITATTLFRSSNLCLPFYHNFTLMRINMIIYNLYSIRTYSVNN